MADIDARKLGKAIGKSLKDPTIVKKDESGEHEIDIGKDGGDKPSFMPDLFNDEEGGLPDGDHDSAIDVSTAIHAVAIIKQELGSINCTLKDYRIEFNVNGFDINHVKIGTNDISVLRTKVGDLGNIKDRHKISSKVSSLAMRAINSKLKERMRNELGIDTQAFEYDGADQGAYSMKTVTEEEPDIDSIANSIDMPDMTPQQPIGPDDIAQDMTDITDQEQPPPSQDGSIPPEMNMAPSGEAPPQAPPPQAPPGQPPAAPNPTI